jgi:hypothetical protein
VRALSPAEREQHESEVAAEEAQGRLMRERMAPRRGKLTMQARINAHRANRATQKLVKRITVVPADRIGLVIGGASAAGLKGR